MITLGFLLFLSAVSASVATPFEDTVNMKWKTIEGKLREITIARDFDSGAGEIYGVSSNGQTWTCRLPCDGTKNKWVTIPGQAAFIAANEQEVWKTLADFSIHRCQKPCSGTWVRQTGQLRSISMGPGVLWGVNHVNDVYMTPVKRGAGPTWQYMSPGNKFNWVSVGIDNDVWGIMRSGEVARFNPVDKTWRKVAGKGKRISVGVKHLYLIDDNDKLMRCKRPCQTGKWKAVENGNARAVAAEWTKGRRVVVLRPDNTIVRGKTPKKCPKCCHHKTSPDQQNGMMSSPYYQYWHSYMMSMLKNQTSNGANQEQGFNPNYLNYNGQSNWSPPDQQSPYYHYWMSFLMSTLKNHTSGAAYNYNFGGQPYGGYYGQYSQNQQLWSAQ